MLAWRNVVPVLAALLAVLTFPASAAAWGCGQAPAEQSTLGATTGAFAHVAHVRPVYAVPADRPNRFLERADTLQAALQLASRQIQETPGSVKGIRYATGGSGCTSANLDFAVVRLSKPAAAYATMNDVFQELRASAPYRAPNDWIVFADFGYEGGGLGNWPNDDRPGPDNAAATGGYLALVMGTGEAEYGIDPERSLARIALHEMTHNLGGVQNSAPNSTLAAHCNDENDIMCYADGGTREEQHQACGSEPLGWWDDALLLGEAYDCNGDDYFNPAPASGSYLASHWNVYDSPFLCATGSCQDPPAPPAAELTVSNAAPRSGEAVTFTASGGVRYLWHVGNGPWASVSPLGSGPQLTIAVYAGAPVTVTVRAVDAQGAFAERSLTVQAQQAAAPPPPPFAPPPRVAPPIPAQSRLHGGVQALADAARRGVLVSGTLVRSGTVTFRLSVSRKTARALRLRHTTLLTTAKWLPSGAFRGVRLKPPAALRKALGRSRRTVTVTVRATGAVDGAATVRLTRGRRATRSLAAARRAPLMLCRFDATGRVISSRRVR